MFPVKWPSGPEAFYSWICIVVNKGGEAISAAAADLDRLRCSRAVLALS